MNKRLLSIVPAAEGWRLIDVSFGFADGLDTATGPELLDERPIACFGLYEQIDDDGTPCEGLERFVLPIVACDWPAYLYADESDQFGHSLASARLDILGPGERLTDEHFREARKRIAQYREIEAAAEARDRSAA